MTLGKNWITATVRDIWDVAADVKAIDLLPEAQTRPFSTGSHLDVSVPVDELRTTRSYSLIGRGPKGGAYRIAVRRLKGGRGSTYMSSLCRGARLRITEPVSHFVLQTGRCEYLLLAGGIGITPLIGMAETLNSNGANFRLLYAGRSLESMPFATELKEMLGPRLKLFISSDGSRLNVAEAISSLHPQGEMYVCGPVKMRDAARRAWTDQGRNNVRMRFETFGSGSIRPSRAFSVYVQEFGVLVDVPCDRSMLDALREANVDVMWDCLRGECGLCAVPVVASTTDIDHQDVFLSDEEKANGALICTCVSRAMGGEVTIRSGYRRL